MHAALALTLVLATPWVWPVEPPHPVVRPYIAPATPYAAGHRGIDIAAPDPDVLAPADGVVHFAGVVVDRPVLSISHDGGLITSYEPVQTELVAGDAVVAGEVVGQVVPGHCESPCLHFGVRLDGQYLSPLGYLGSIPRAVLLPTRRG
jgi:murein DD-endopeptidase MepM/ murein hydrolase activator NlpD